MERVARFPAHARAEYEPVHASDCAEAVAVPPAAGGRVRARLGECAPESTRVHLELDELPIWREWASSRLSTLRRLKSSDVEPRTASSTVDSRGRTVAVPPYLNRMSRLGPRRALNMKRPVREVVTCATWVHAAPGRSASS